MKNQHSIYGGSIESARQSSLGIFPFQSLAIRLDGQDRTNGEFFAVEGNELYCERSDYPILFSLNTPIAQGQGLVFRNGAQYRTPFRGVYVYHPFIAASGGSTQQFNAFFQVSKVGASYENNLNDTRMAMPITYRIVTANAAQLELRIFLPPGTRSVIKATLAFASTTVTGVGLYFVDAFGNNIGPIQSLTQKVGAAVVSYITSGASGRVGIATATGVVGQVMATFDNITVPTGAVEAVIAVLGTGLGVGVTTANAFIDAVLA
jgi:hypothetical protein